MLQPVKLVAGLLRQPSHHRQWGRTHRPRREPKWARGQPVVDQHHAPDQCRRRTSRSDCQRNVRTCPRQTPETARESAFDRWRIDLLPSAYESPADVMV